MGGAAGRGPIEPIALISLRTTLDIAHDEPGESATSGAAMAGKRKTTAAGRATGSRLRAVALGLVLAALVLTTTGLTGCEPATNVTSMTPPLSAPSAPPAPVPLALKVFPGDHGAAAARLRRGAHPASGRRGRHGDRDGKGGRGLRRAARGPSSRGCRPSRSRSTARTPRSSPRPARTVHEDRRRTTHFTTMGQARPGDRHRAVPVRRADGRRGDAGGGRVRPGRCRAGPAPACSGGSSCAAPAAAGRLDWPSGKPGLLPRRRTTGGRAPCSTVRAALGGHADGRRPLRRHRPRRHVRIGRRIRDGRRQRAPSR